jgi:hypothetical protein
MSASAQLPQFAHEAWYRDPSDHRCPHDAWLEALEVSEPATGKRSEARKTAITVRLLGAYQDGHIIFRYTGVTKYSLEGGSCRRGLGDWLEDTFSVDEAGQFVHRITWAGFGSSEESKWSIESEGVTYEWTPKEANQSPEPTAPSGRGSS